MEVVGYSYDAGIHCPSCTFDYARGVEYTDYVFGEYSDEDISDVPGMFNMQKAIELEIIRDNENNPIHPIFSTDEAGDAPEHCEDCNAYIDTSWSGETVKYAADALWSYVEGRVLGTHAGNPEVLDVWKDELRWCFTSKADDLVISLYETVRESEDS